MESCPIQNSIDGRAILEALKYSLMAFFLALWIAFEACFLLGAAIMKIIAAMPRAIIRHSYQEIRAFEIACRSVKDVMHTTLVSCKHSNQSDGGNLNGYPKPF